MDDIVEDVFRKCQKYLENVPVVIIGSGFSIPYGLPTMTELGKHITEKLSSKYETDPSWKEFVDSLKKKNNLELALQESKVTKCIYEDILKVTWQLINTKDQIVFKKHLNNFEENTISDIFYKLLQPHPRVLKVITSNYDRVIEYSIDRIQANIDCGFSGNNIQNFIGVNKSKKINNNTVMLCKVHGSLDWFREVSDNQVIAVTNSTIIHDGLTPAIVTPGYLKYQETHFDPYRSLIVTADEFIRDATSYLCIGYGFNDEHLQPKLIEHVHKYNKPIVIVTKTLSKMGKEILKKSNKHIVFEEEDEENTKVTIDGKVIIIKGKYWILENFYKSWI